MLRVLRIFGPSAQRRADFIGSSRRPAAWPVDADEITAEYLRRIYANIRDWYTVSETKAQILLAAHGAFISVVAGTLLGVSGGIPAATKAKIGPETWVFLGIAIACVIGAVSCASLAMWSLHGRPSRKQFTKLIVDPLDPSTYRPEMLWYFGHLALLEPKAASARLQKTTTQDEIVTLSYHIVELSSRVLRKHRYVNAGWALTATGLIALSATAISLFIRGIV